MSPVRDFLQRFLPAGTPGKAAAAGVPADRSAAAAELDQVLDQLEAAEKERGRILSEADSDARRIRDDARRHAEGIVAAARERAQAVRAEAAAAVLAEAEEAAGLALQQAERDAREITGRAALRMDDQVRRAVQAVRALAGEESGQRP